MQIPRPGHAVTLRRFNEERVCSETSPLSSALSVNFVTSGSRSRQRNLLVGINQQARQHDGTENSLNLVRCSITLSGITGATGSELKRAP